MDIQPNKKTPGRNDPCPCGSGKKFKKCCGLNTGKSAIRETVDGDLETGFSLYRNGDIAGAVAIAQRYILTNPDLPEASLLLGMCNYSRGNLVGARKNILKANTLAENLQNKNIVSNIKLMLSVIEQNLGNFENAEHSARDAIDLGFNSSLTYNALGAALVAQKKFKEAITAFQHALGIDAMDAELWENLGICYYRLFEHTKAVTCYQKAIELNPAHASAYRKLGTTYMDLYRYDAAIDQFLLFLKFDAEDAFITSNLGAAYAYLGRLDEAYKWLTRSISLDADRASTYLAFGIYYQKKGENENCKKMLYKTLAKEPENIFFRAKITGILEESCAFREREEVLIRFREIQKLEAWEIEPLIPTLLRLNYTNTLSSGDIKRLHLLVGEYLSNKIVSSEYSHDNASYSENSIIRIGYVSTDFRDHSVGFFIRNIIGAHDPDRFEVYCYADLDKSDAITEEIKSKSSQFKDITSLSDESLAKLIYDDQIQILVDLNGYTGRRFSSTIRLPVFAYKPAPVQVTYLGYPNTTGMKAIDYRITDKFAEDPDGTQYSEELLEMPECFLCFGSFLNQDIDPVPAFERNGYITFGSFNNTAKLTREGIGVWSEILHRVANSVILIKAVWLDQEIAKENILMEFESNGVERHRVHLHGNIDQKIDHLGFYNKIDIALDTFPYNGTTTTCEALWMGVPVIALVGNKHVQRVSYSILKNIGHAELVAHSEKEYIDMACELASNRELIRELRNRLPDDLSKSILCNPDRFTRQLEQVYLDIWDKYIGGRH